MNNKNLPQTLVMNEGVQGGRSLSSTTDSAAAPASAGVRESTQSWREVLLNLKSRGMNAPKLAIGDGAIPSQPPGALSVGGKISEIGVHVQAISHK